MGQINATFVWLERSLTRLACFIVSEQRKATRRFRCRLIWLSKLTLPCSREQKTPVTCSPQKILKATQTTTTTMAQHDPSHVASSQKALMLELKSLQEEPVEGFKITLVDEADLYNWEVAIFGPPNTHYEGGYFKVRKPKRKMVLA